MKKVLSSIWNVAFAVAVAVALSFGAAEALSGTTQQHLSEEGICTYPDYCETDEFCEWLCDFRGHLTGECIMSKNCCLCVD
jgi:hypothetical protein